MSANLASCSRRLAEPTVDQKTKAWGHAVDVVCAMFLTVGLDLPRVRSCRSKKGGLRRPPPQKNTDGAL